MSASTVILLASTIKTAEWNNPRDYGKVTSVSSINDVKPGMRALIAFNSNTHVVFAIDSFTPLEMT